MADSSNDAVLTFTPDGAGEAVAIEKVTDYDLGDAVNPVDVSTLDDAEDVSEQGSGKKTATITTAGAAVLSKCDVGVLAVGYGSATPTDLGTFFVSDVATKGSRNQKKSTVYTFTLQREEE